MSGNSKSSTGTVVASDAEIPPNLNDYSVIVVDYGSITEPAATIIDCGSIVDPANLAVDHGSVARGGLPASPSDMGQVDG